MDADHLPTEKQAVIPSGRRARPAAREVPIVAPPIVVAAGGSPWRGLAVGLAGVCILGVVTPYVEGYLQGSNLAETFLPTGVFVLFLLMLGLNVVLRLLSWPLTPQELMLAYTTMLVSSTIPSQGFALRVVPVLVDLYYYATPMNEWATMHFSHVPSWMTPHGDDVVTWFFMGVPPGESIPWWPWVKPLGLWCLLIAGMFMMMAALSVALRKRWMDAERLQFPLAQIPLLIMGEDPAPSWRSPFFHNPLMWAGAALPLVLHIMNGLHAYFPAVPAIVLTGHQFGTMFSGSQILVDPPFYRWADIKINVYWSVIGISYLLRSEVSLSVWAFQWFYRIEEIIFEVSGYGWGMYNWSPLHTFGYTLMTRYQRVGAMLLAAFVLLWASRRELREMVRAAVGRMRAGDPQTTIPRWTLWAFLLGLTIYLVWTTAAGMRLLPAVIILVFFLLASMITARVVAATGLLWVENQALTMQNLGEVMGTARIDPRTFTQVGFMSFVPLNDPTNVMPQMLDSMKIVRQTDIRQGHFFLGMGLGLVVAMVVSCATVLWLAYSRGAVNLTPLHFHDDGDWLFSRVANLQRYHVFTHWSAIGCMAAGASVMSLLLYLHRAFLWWPFYPLGFIIAGPGPGDEIWFPVLVGWLARWLAPRFGGLRLGNRLKAVALGLVLGEFASVGIWLVVDAATGTLMHKVFPVG